MTRKHFEAIASILAQHGADAGLAADLANYFAAENPRFDVDRFMKAAGVSFDAFTIHRSMFGPAQVIVDEPAIDWTDDAPAFEVVGEAIFGNPDWSELAN